VSRLVACPSVTSPAAHSTAPAAIAAGAGSKPRSRSHAAGNAVPAWQIAHTASDRTTPPKVQPCARLSSGTIAPKPYCCTPAASIAAAASQVIHVRGRPSSSRSGSPTR
jgi:hypothetical protein